MGACASCARQKRRCKLRSVVFPPRIATRPPEWLPWGEGDWSAYGPVWYDQVDEVLNVDNYLLRFFDTTTRLKTAELE
eukprot:297692-Karenia_brevis.AAC.1